MNPPEGHIPGIDVEHLTRWFGEHLDWLTGPLRFERISGGRSNLTFGVTDADGRRVVLRRPPLGKYPATAHDVLREARLLRAIATDVPVPEVLASCDDDSVTGAPFFVMSFLDGLVLRDPQSAAAGLGVTDRALVGPRMVDTLLTLHDVDPARLGLGKLTERRDYVTRQLHRWNENWHRIRTRELPDLSRTHEWLVAHVPPQRRTTIVHGDFRVDNCVLDPSVNVLGLLDWELTTVGDPMADLGQLLVYWSEPGDSFTALHDPPTRAPGFSARAELRERYLSASGADESDVDFFTSFNWWKIGCIVEDVYSRMRSGAMGETDRSAEEFGEQARELAAEALRHARG